MSGSYVRYACGCIDIHTHVVPETFPKYMGSDMQARWPEMVAASPCRRHVMLQGEIYRTVTNQSWEMAARLVDMERMRVSAQVLSPMPELLSYWLDPADGTAMCQFLNDTIAGYVALHPDRFFGLGAVPLQDPERAIATLDYAVRKLGLSGVLIGTNVNGVPVGDARFRPFFEACSELGASVLVHPLRPAGRDRLIGLRQYEQLIAFPGEVGLAAMSMITGGTLAALPALRIAFTHGGGSLPIVTARLQHAWEIMPAVREALTEAPRESVRRMFYDELLYDQRAIETLIGLAGETQVTVGTDYPFTIADREPDSRLASLEVDANTRKLIQFENALRWLGVEQPL